MSKIYKLPEVVVQVCRGQGLDQLIRLRAPDGTYLDPLM